MFFVIFLRILLAVVFLIAVSIIMIFLYSFPAYFRLRGCKKQTILGEVCAIEDAINYLKKADKLEGWDLVAAAQSIVNQKMEYSRRNNWDSPRRAFARGMGYCWQQAEALKMILDGLGIESRLVQSARNLFPPKKIHEYESKGGYCGHAWLKVNINGVEKDVCPGHPENKPGKIHFVIAGKVSDYKGIIKYLGHLGSVLMNRYWDRRALAELRKING